MGKGRRTSNSQTKAAAVTKESKQELSEAKASKQERFKGKAKKKERSEPNALAQADSSVKCSHSDCYDDDAALSEDASPEDASEDASPEDASPEDASPEEADNQHAELEALTLGMDEMEDFFAGKEAPKIMVTTGPSNRTVCRRCQKFLRNFVPLFPGAIYIPRRRDSFLKEAVDAAIKHKFSVLILISQRMNEVHKMHIFKLPEGPVASFRLTNFVPARELEGKGRFANYDPEMIFKNFDKTPLGKRVERLLTCLLPLKPEFVGRRVITFHNERDFIFFRHYVYVFTKDGEKVRLEETGPRFTLKLRLMKKGIDIRTVDDNDSNGATTSLEFNWRPKMSLSRKEFNM